MNCFESPHICRKFPLPVHLRRKDFIHQFFIESFGVRIGFASNSSALLEDVKKSLSFRFPGYFSETSPTEIKHYFVIVETPGGKVTAYKNKKLIFARTNREDALQLLDSEIRITIAISAKEKVFIHAGAVNWKDRAIIFPASSFSGKTSLALALMRRGALYYSDEYAVLNKNGWVEPFAKPLSIRGEIDKYSQVDYKPESLGGKVGTKEIPLGLVLITKYRKYGKWNPQVLTRAKGIIEMIKSSVSIRYNPSFTIDVLKTAADQAIFVKSNRPDAERVADLILDFFEANCLKDD